MKTKNTSPNKLFWVIVVSIFIVVIASFSGIAMVRKMRNDSIDCNKMRQEREDGDKRGIPVNFSSDVIDKCFKN